MSKDGTNCGGARPGAGRKPKAISEKIASGNPGGRKLTVVDFGDEAVNLKGSEMPPVKDYLKASIKAVLQNYAYTGNLLLQKSRRVDHLTKRDAPNNGELPQYHVQGCHEAIIPLRLFNAVQEEMRHRANKHTHPRQSKKRPHNGSIGASHLKALVLQGFSGKNKTDETTKSYHSFAHL